MALIPHEPFNQLNQWRRDVDRFFTGLPTLFGGWERDFGVPRVDVYETENEVVASCEIPGLEKKEDVSIDVEDNVLNISGIVNKFNEVKDEQMHRQERFTGRFQRSVSLPARVNPEGVKATYRNGILEVRMPKEQADNRRRIDVEFH